MLSKSKKKVSKKAFKSVFNKKEEKPKRMYEMGMLERNQMWSQKKKKKIDKARRNQKKSEVSDCTFEPRILSYKPH